MKVQTTKKCCAAKTVAVKKPAAKCAAAPKKAACKVAKKSVTFTVHADKGKAVYVAGEFNDWNPTAKKMAYKAADGIYAASVELPVGTYQYKFVIDGTWCADPENVNAVANDQGTFNSVITVA